MPEMKPELSKKNPYWISKHRYYQLVHYCLQYNEWKDMRRRIGDISAVNLDGMPKSTGPSRGIENAGVRRAELKHKMELIEHTAREADPALAEWIVKGVTNDGIGYDYLRDVMGIPCGRRQYHERRRKFFWLLSQKLGE